MTLCSTLALAAPPTAPTLNAAQQKLNDPEVEATIRRLEKEVVEAHSNDDLQKLFAPNVYYYNSFPETIGSFTDLVAHMGKLIPNVTNWKVDVLEMHIVARKDLAVASSIQRWTSDSTKTGKPVMEQYYRQTDTWEKIDGKWMITFAHSSFPVDPATERVACVRPGGYCPLPNWPHD
jgi:hypothetical protein